MEIKEAFAGALKQIRKARGLTQESFSDVSSRTYISTLERGIKSPTIDKIDDLAKAMGIHPLTLLTLTYMVYNEDSNPSKLINLISKELNQLSLIPLISYAEIK